MTRNKQGFVDAGCVVERDVVVEAVGWKKVRSASKSPIRTWTEGEVRKGRGQGEGEGGAKERETPKKKVGSS